MTYDVKYNFYRDLRVRNCILCLCFRELVAGITEEFQTKVDGIGGRWSHCRQGWKGYQI